MRKLLSAALFALVICSSSILSAQNVSTVAGTGTNGYSGDGGKAAAAKLDHPVAIKFDKTGNMYIADERNHVIRRVSTGGVISTIAGTGVAGFSGRDGIATAAQLSHPVDVALDNAGNIYIAESGNNVISKILPNGLIKIFAGTGVNGNNGDGAPATSAQIHNPMGMVFDYKGNMYFSANGSHTIRKVDTGGIITTYAGTGVSGYAGDGGPATAAELGLTGYLAIGYDTALYIPDYYNHTIRKVDTTGKITLVAGTGSMGTDGDEGPATAACINSPYALRFGRSHKIYVSDAFDYVLRMIDTNMVIHTVAGTGVAGYNGDGAPATATQLNANLNCSDTDAAGNYYIADPTNNRIRAIIYNTLGVHEIATASRLFLFPNPASNTITINTGEKIDQVIITNLTGQTVFKQQYNKPDKTNIDISTLPAGIYIVQVNDVYSCKFFKE